MLQKIFGYKVELVEHSDEYTVVRADRPVKVGTQIPVKVSDANGQRTPAVPMVVLSCRECEHDGYIITGRFLVEHPDLSGFQIPPGIGSDASLRSDPRVSCHLCVISRDLPGYRVMTIDISEGGLQVEAPSKVALGSSVLLRLEFDTEKLPPIQASATVAWCTQVDRGRFRIGLKFNSLDQRSEEVIGIYRQLVSRRAVTDVSLRTIKDASLNEDVGETAALPSLQVLQWHQVPLMKTAILVGYRRFDGVVQLRLQGGETGLQCHDYAFYSVKSLKDTLDCDPSARPVAEFRFAELNDGYFRFQLLDAQKASLLEIEAKNCTEQSPTQN